MKHTRLILTWFCLLISTGYMMGRDSLMFHDISHHMTVELIPSYNIPTHGYYRGFNDHDEAVPAAGAMHLKYGFSLNPESRPGALYPTAYQGIGLGVQSFFHHKMTGTPILLYIYQGSRIADLGTDISVGYEWNLGASYGWKTNQVVSSLWNIYINVCIPFTCQISPSCRLSLGPEFTHYSNGDTSFPNGGANTVGCRIGFTYATNENADTRSPGRALFQTDKMSFRNHMEYDLAIYGGFRAKRQMNDSWVELINKPFATAGLTFNPHYRFNRYFSAGPSLDILYDSSTSETGFLKQSGCGLSAKGELSMPFFAVNIGAGYGISDSYQLRGFYTTYGLKFFMNDKLFVTINYRLSSRQYCHNLMFGMGIRLK